MKLCVCQHCNYEFCGKCQELWSKHNNGKKKCKEIAANDMGEWFQSSDFSNCPKCHVRVEK